MAQRIGAGGYFQQQPFDHADDHGLSRPSSRGGARPVMMAHDDYSECDSDDTWPYSPRPHTWGPVGQRHDRDWSVPDLRWSPSPEPEHQFFIIREGTPATPPPPPPPLLLLLREPHLQPRNDYRQQQQQQQHFHQAPPPPPPPASPAPVACFMERTHSGRTILTETDLQPAACPPFSHKDDSEAALRVQQHLAKPHARGNVRRHERILRTLINPRDKATDFPLDNAALESIFSAADEIFFQGRLSRRVHWEWSSGCVNVAGTKQGGRIIGTTALRAAEGGGYETLIVLSSPILKDTSYNRRLLISTFLHELIHSFLFICCGFKARHCGGHTDGFKAIARLVDQWEGQGSLRLCDMEADLEHFREESSPPSPLRHSTGSHSPSSCHHHGGGVDFYNIKASPWSTGPRVVFGAHGPDMNNKGRWSTGSPMHMPTPRLPSPMSAASALVDSGDWGAHDDLDTTPRSLDMRGNTFLGPAMKPYALH